MEMDRKKKKRKAEKRQKQRQAFLWVLSTTQKLRPTTKRKEKENTKWPIYVNSTVSKLCSFNNNYKVLSFLFPDKKERKKLSLSWREIKTKIIYIYKSGLLDLIVALFTCELQVCNSNCNYPKKLKANLYIIYNFKVNCYKYQNCWIYFQT